MLIGLVQDVSGWTPLMIAASLKNAEGDPIVDLLLRKDADVNIKSVTGQVGFLQELYSFMEVILTDSHLYTERSPSCHLEIQPQHRQDTHSPQMQRKSKRQARSATTAQGCSSRLYSHTQNTPGGR